MSGKRRPSTTDMECCDQASGTAERLECKAPGARSQQATPGLRVWVVVAVPGRFFPEKITTLAPSGITVVQKLNLRTGSDHVPCTYRTAKAAVETEHGEFTPLRAINLVRTIEMHNLG